MKPLQKFKIIKWQMLFLCASGRILQTMWKLLFLFLYIFLYVLPLTEPIVVQFVFWFLTQWWASIFITFSASTESIRQNKNSTAMTKSCYRETLVLSIKILLWLQRSKTKTSTEFEILVSPSQKVKKSSQIKSIINWTKWILLFTKYWLYF